MMNSLTLLADMTPENRTFVLIALAVFVLVLCLNLVGNALRDALDPRGTAR